MNEQLNFDEARNHATWIVQHFPKTADHYRRLDEDLQDHKERLDCLSDDEIRDRAEAASFGNIGYDPTNVNETLTNLIFTMPFLDPERAVKFYEETVQKQEEYPDVADTCIIGAMGVALATGRVEPTATMFSDQLQSENQPLFIETLEAIDAVIDEEQPVTLNVLDAVLQSPAALANLSAQNEMNNPLVWEAIHARGKAAE